MDPKTSWIDKTISYAISSDGQVKKAVKISDIKSAINRIKANVPLGICGSVISGAAAEEIEHAHGINISIFVDSSFVQKIKGAENTSEEQPQTQGPIVNKEEYENTIKRALSGIGLDQNQVNRIVINIIPIGEEDIKRLAEELKKELIKEPKKTEELKTEEYPALETQESEDQITGKITPKRIMFLLLDPQVTDELKEQRKKLIKRLQEMNKQNPGIAEEMWKEVVKSAKLHALQLSEEEKNEFKFPETFAEAVTLYEDSPEAQSGKITEIQAPIIVTGAEKAPFGPIVPPEIRPGNRDIIRPPIVSSNNELSSITATSTEEPAEQIIQEVREVIPAQSEQEEEKTIGPITGEEPAIINSGTDGQVPGKSARPGGGIASGINKAASLARMGGGIPTSPEGALSTAIKATVVTGGTNWLLIIILIVLGLIFFGALGLSLDYYFGGGGGSQPDGGEEPIVPSDQIPGLKLTKTGPSQVNPGENIQYKIEGEYTGADSVILADIVPDGTKYSSSDGSYNANSKTVTWEIKSGETFSHNLFVTTENKDYWVTNIVYANLTGTGVIDSKSQSLGQVFEDSARKSGIPTAFLKAIASKETNVLTFSDEEVGQFSLLDWWLGKLDNAPRLKENDPVIIRGNGYNTCQYLSCRAGADVRGKMQFEIQTWNGIKGKINTVDHSPDRRYVKDAIYGAGIFIREKADKYDMAYHFSNNPTDWNEEQVKALARAYCYGTPTPQKRSIACDTSKGKYEDVVWDRYQQFK